MVGKYLPLRHYDMLHVHKMSDKSLKSQVLESQMDYLATELGDPSRYFPPMRAKGVLSHEDCEQIRSRTTSRDKTLEFIQIISHGRESTGGAHAFDVFVDALKKQRVQAHIGRQLQRAFTKQKQEEEMKRGIEARSSTAETDGNGFSIASQPQSQSQTSRQQDPQFDVHPLYGAMPPPHSQQPPSTQPVQQNTQDTHPKYGAIPSPPPSTGTGTVAAQQATHDFSGTMETGRYPFIAGEVPQGQPLEPRAYSTLSDSESGASLNQPMDSYSNSSLSTLQSSEISAYSSNVPGDDPHYLKTELAKSQQEVSRLREQLRLANKEITDLKTKLSSLNIMSRGAPAHQQSASYDKKMMQGEPPKPLSSSSGEISLSSSVTGEFGSISSTNGSCSVNSHITKTE